MVLRESAVLSFEVLEQLAFVLNQDRVVTLLQCSHGQEDLLGPFDHCNPLINTDGSRALRQNERLH